MRNSRKRFIGVQAILPAVALTALCGVWVATTGALVGPEAIVAETIAQAPDDHLERDWVKSDYSRPSAPPENRSWLSPLPVMARMALGAVGWEHWSRGHAIAIFGIGATVAAIGWAIGLPQWAAALATLFLLLLPNQLLQEVLLAQSSPWIVAGLFLALGFFIRDRSIAAGTAIGALVWLRWDAWVIVPAFFMASLVMALLTRRNRAPRTVRSSILLLFTAALVISPLCLRAVSNGADPWGLSHTSAWIVGKAASTRWLPDRDSGWSDDIVPLRAYDDYDHLVRKRWDELIEPWIGKFAIETMTMGFVIAAAVLIATYLPQARPLVILGLCLLPWLISIGAAQGDLFNRRLLIPIDALMICVLFQIALNRAWIKARPILATIVSAWLAWVAWPGVQQAVSLFTKRPDQPLWFGDFTRMQAEAVSELNLSNEPLLTAPIQGLALAYYLAPQPIIELPSNWNNDGIVDPFLERFKIAWSLIPGEMLREKSQRYDFTIHRTAKGLVLYRVTPRAPVSPQSEQGQ